MITGIEKPFGPYQIFYSPPAEMLKVQHLKVEVYMWSVHGMHIHTLAAVF